MGRHAKGSTFRNKKKKNPAPYGHLQELFISLSSNLSVSRVDLVTGSSLDICLLMQISGGTVAVVKLELV